MLRPSRERAGWWRSALERDQALGELSNALAEIATQNVLLSIDSADVDSLVVRGERYGRLVDWQQPVVSDNPNIHWKGWITLQPLRREAEAMILGSIKREVDLGNRYGSRGKWHEAARHFAVAFKSDNPGYSTWHLRYATLLLETGNVQGYQQLCSQMLQWLQEADNSVDAVLTAKVCLLDPSAEEFVSEALKMAQRGLDYAHAEQNEYVASYAQLAIGLAELRQKNPQQAIERCQKCLSRNFGGWTQRTQAQFVTAMAYHQLGDRDRAQTEFDAAIEILRNHRPNFDGESSDGWHNWLMCQHLRREADLLFRTDTLTNRP